MFESIELKNFRGFRKRSKAALGPLTFLVGPNSGGKSSIASALMFLEQSGLISLESVTPNWSGELVDLGSYDDTVNGRNKASAIELSVCVKNWNRSINLEPAHATKFSYVFKRGTDPHGFLSSLCVADAHRNVGLELRRRQGKYPSYDGRVLDHRFSWKPEAKSPGYMRPFYRYTSRLSRLAALEITKAIKGSSARNIYGAKSALRRLAAAVGDHSAVRTIPEFAMTRVDSGRGGPRRLFPRTSLDEVASSGQNNRVRFSGVSPEDIESFQTYRGRAAKLHASHVRQVRNRRWLSEFLLKLDIADEIRVAHTSPYHNSIEVRDNRTNVWTNLVDVGYGASQVIPVALACASPSAGVVFIEQPEVHLHPRAQRAVGELLCDVAMERQVIVETHSVHLINAARSAIARRLISCDDVRIVYVDRDEHGSRITQIGLDEEGNFTTEWPSGFFNERFEDTMELARIQSERD